MLVKKTPDARKGNSGRQLKLTLGVKLTMKKEKLLSNNENKQELIKLLSEEISREGRHYLTLLVDSFQINIVII